MKTMLISIKSKQEIILGLYIVISKFLLNIVLTCCDKSTPHTLLLLFAFQIFIKTP